MPARVGDNSVDLVATGPDGRPLKVLEWFASATLPSRGIAPVSLQLRQVGDDRATAAVALPVPGAWKFRFALRVTDIDQASVTGTVPVR